MSNYIIKKGLPLVDMWMHKEINFAHFNYLVLFFLIPFYVENNMFSIQI